MNATDAVPSARVVERRGMTRSGRMASLNNYTHSFHMHANDVNESTSDIRLQPTHPIDKMVTRADIQWILEWNLKQHCSARLLGIGFRSVLDCAGISGISGPRTPKRVSIFKWRKKCLSTNCESSCEESIISRIPGKKNRAKFQLPKWARFSFQIVMVAFLPSRFQVDIEHTGMFIRLTGSWFTLLMTTCCWWCWCPIPKFNFYYLFCVFFRLRCKCLGNFQTNIKFKIVCVCGSENCVLHEVLNLIEWKLVRGSKTFIRWKFPTSQMWMCPR